MMFVTAARPKFLYYHFPDMSVKMECRPSTKLRSPQGENGIANIQRDTQSEILLRNDAWAGHGSELDLTDMMTCADLETTTDVDG